MSCNLVIPISGSECIGDSRVKINNNFDSLCNAINALSAETVVRSPGGTTSTINSYVIGAGRILYSDVRNNSLSTIHISNNAVTTDKIALSSVGTAQLSAQAVTTDKIALSAVTTQTIANSAITAEKMSGGQTGSAPIYGIRAWVNFDCTRNNFGNTDSLNTDRFIRASGNVQNVTKTGNGSYRLTFTTNMPHTNYVWSGSCYTVNGYVYATTTQNTPTLSTLEVYISNDTQVLNPSIVTVSVVC